jgi:hypothetical protein
MSEPVHGMELTGIDEPGGDVGAGPDGARPQPDSAPGDRAGGWLKVGAGYEGGRQFEYDNGYYGADGPAPWKQT